ncbi:MAG TPA: hypothetical protein VFS07_04800 [Gemmatimonadales bacterium]|jgi:hypothetical protein|nr:hypothetical protein [Gemmatimonadales bacterium]
MTGTYRAGAQRDTTIKYLVGGGVVVVGLFVLVFAFIVSEIERVGPAGSGAIAGLGAVIAAAFGAMMLGPLGRAIGKRILEGGAPAPVLEELDDLRLQVDELRQALAETQERLDFTERVLARGDAAPEDLH